MIIINFKTYEEVNRNDGIVNLTRICNQIYDKYKVPLVLCVQATDIYKAKMATSLPVFAQHIDPIEPGKNTGFISWLAVKNAGATGVMINHSEHRIGMKNIEKTIKICQRENLQTLVCVENAQEAKEVDQMGTDMIALEDPALIGGDVSIVKNEEGKQKVKEFAAINLKAKCLVGAGVKDKDDITESIKLGASGVLLASGVVKASDPKAILKDLCEGFNK